MKEEFRFALKTWATQFYQYNINKFSINLTFKERYNFALKTKLPSSISENVFFIGLQRFQTIYFWQQYESWNCKWRLDWNLFNRWVCSRASTSEFLEKAGIQEVKRGQRQKLKYNGNKSEKQGSKEWNMVSAINWTIMGIIAQEFSFL